MVRMMLGVSCAVVMAVSISDASAATEKASKSTFGTSALAASWQLADGALSGLVVTDHRHQASIQITDPFSLTFKDGSTLASDDFRLHGELRETLLDADSKASRLVERYAGKAVEARFMGPRGHVRIHWTLVQRQGSDYLREVVTITALDRDAAITKVVLFGANAPDAFLNGTVDGSPVVSRDDWLGFEHPMSKADAWRGKVKLGIERTLPLAKGKSVTYSAVIGVARAGQMRRDFATYIERERAHPYRPFLHYNS